MTAEQKAILASTPGRILKEEFLKGYGLSQAELSRRTGIPRSSINEIIKGMRLWALSAMRRRMEWLAAEKRSRVWL